MPIALSTVVSAHRCLTRVLLVLLLVCGILLAGAGDQAQAASPSAEKTISPSPDSIRAFAAWRSDPEAGGLDARNQGTGL